MLALLLACALAFPMVGTAGTAFAADPTSPSIAVGTLRSGDGTPIEVTAGEDFVVPVWYLDYVGNRIDRANLMMSKLPAGFSLKACVTDFEDYDELNGTNYHESYGHPWLRSGDLLFDTAADAFIWSYPSGLAVDSRRPLYYLLISTEPNANNDVYTVTQEMNPASSFWFSTNVETDLKPMPEAIIPATVVITGGIDKRAPELIGSATALASVEEGSAYELDLSTIFIDVNGDKLEYTVDILDPSSQSSTVSADESFSFMPVVLGTYTLTFTASDGEGTSPAYVVTLAVTIVKSVLAAVVSTATTITQDGYTNATWALFSDALSTAVAVLADDSATQAEVDSALLALETAIKNLSGPPVDITVSIQMDNTGLYLAQQVFEDVPASLSERYGYVDEFNGIKATTLDAMVMAHIAYYGEEGVDSSVLAINSSGVVTKLMGITTDRVDMFVNGAMPHDGVLKNWPGQTEKSYTGDNVAQTVLFDGDKVNFVTMQDGWGMDYFSWFEQGGTAVDTVTVQAGDSFELTLKGYIALFYGLSDSATLTANTEALGDAQLVRVHPDSSDGCTVGYFEEIDGAVTDFTGKVSLSFARPGTYFISAIGDEYSPIVSPWLAVTVQAQTPTPLSDISALEALIVRAGRYIQADFTVMSWEALQEVLVVAKGIVADVGASQARIDVVAVTLKAAIDGLDPSAYLATVTGGTGAGSFVVGATVTITASEREGQVFAGWTSSSAGVSFADATSPTTTFTMPANAVMVTATFVPRGVTYALSVTGGTGTGLYAEGEAVTITATPPEGQTFARWIAASEGVSFANAASATTTFVMPANAVEITATLVPFALTVTGGTGAGSYLAGETVTISATVPEGQVFSRWSSSSAGVDFANPASPTTTFIMPINAVAITAGFTPYTYALTVVGGRGEGSYAAGDSTVITADLPSAGKVFDKWVTSSGGTFLDATHAATTFTMPASKVTVTATYKLIPTYDVTRLAGNTAPETSVAISQASFVTSNIVVLARADDFQDAMSATGLAGAFNAPILLSNRNVLSASVKSEITRLGAKKIYIIGGTGAISPQIDTNLRTIAGVTDVQRVWGNASWDTSVACAKLIKANGGAGDKVIVAVSINFQDALSISSFAYKYKVPIFLQTSGETAASRALPAEAIDLISPSGNSIIYVPGGAGAVSEASVEGVFGTERIVRLWGSDGYDTSSAIAKYMIDNSLLSPYIAVFACGAKDPQGVDALAGAAFAGTNDATMLLVNENPGTGGAVNTVTLSNYLVDRTGAVGRAYVLGGTYVMPDTFIEKVKRALGW